MVIDVVGGRLTVAVREPPGAETDEDASEASGTRRVIVVSDVARPTGKIDHHGDDERRIDGMDERGDE